MTTRPVIELPASRVAVYIDFDNIVISRYDQTWGRGKFHAERLRSADVDDAAVGARVERARVDIGAILDYASSFGTMVASRAYADWSVPVNAAYRQQLLGRAVDLVQLFPSTRGMKNGADIRLAVDVVEDLFRLPDLTHVVIVAGDSDYIALAQRAKRLGRFVVGIGVAGSTSRSLAAACDEFADYDALPVAQVPAAEPLRRPRRRRFPSRSQTSRTRPSTPATGRPTPARCWSGRCGSGTPRTTTTGCTQMWSRRR